MFSSMLYSYIIIIIYIYIIDSDNINTSPYCPYLLFLYVFPSPAPTPFSLEVGQEVEARPTWTAPVSQRKARRLSPTVNSTVNDSK